mgnify:CR=1 FL=1|tara:strand:+ start:6221 stop:6469 length:249 start_codon:yes stop_codon:yes gene_type:complete
MDIEEIIAKAYRTGAASNVKRILTVDEIIEVSDKANIYAAKVVKSNSVLGSGVKCKHDFQIVERGCEYLGNQCECGEWEDLS